MAGLEIIPEGKLANGNFRALFVPTIADPAEGATLAELNASGTKALTYSGSGDDGYNHTTNESTINVFRTSLSQAIQYAGDVTDDIELKYVYTNTDGDVVRLALPEGQEGFIVEVWAVANGDDLATEMLHDIIPIRAGLQRKDRPARNAELTRTQRLYVTGEPARDKEIQAA